MPPYLHERQTEYWTSRAVEDYFLDAGFEVLTFPLTQLTERHLPADFLFFDKKTSKLFGFQYKPLYKNEPDFWPINERQRADLQGVDWIYYSLSEIRSGKDHRLALHKQIITSPTEIPEGKELHVGTKFIYYRWGGFVEALERCRTGRLIRSEQDLRAAFAPILDKPEASAAIDVFLAGFEQRRMVHLSPHLSPTRGTGLDADSDNIHRRQR
jgi:hypothetical protein